MRVEAPLLDVADTVDAASLAGLRCPPSVACLRHRTVGDGCYHLASSCLQLRVAWPVPPGQRAELHFYGSCGKQGGPAMGDARMGSRSRVLLPARRLMDFWQ